jgi:hypothetical protein
MSDNPATDRPANKPELLERLRASRAELNTVLDALTDDQLVSPRDAGGWSIKDHVLNIALWERSIVNLLRGAPRYEALGVDEDTYLELDEHGLNAIMVAEWRQRPVREVLALYRDSHQQMLVVLDALSWDDLQQPYAHFLPDEPGAGDDRPVINWVLGNTADHYDQHREWIEAIAEPGEHA